MISMIIIDHHAKRQERPWMSRGGSWLSVDKTMYKVFQHNKIIQIVGICYSRGYVQAVKTQSVWPYVNSLLLFGCLLVTSSIKSHCQVRFHTSTPHHFRKIDFWSFTFLRLIIVVFDTLHPYESRQMTGLHLCTLTA